MVIALERPTVVGNSCDEDWRCWKAVPIAEPSWIPVKVNRPAAAISGSKFWTHTDPAFPATQQHVFLKDRVMPHAVCGDQPERFECCSHLLRCLAGPPARTFSYFLHLWKANQKNTKPTKLAYIFHCLQANNVVSAKRYEIPWYHSDQLARCQLLPNALLD